MASHQHVEANLIERQRPVWDIQQFLPVVRHEESILHRALELALIARAAICAQKGVRIAGDAMAQPQPLCIIALPVRTTGSPYLAHLFALALVL